MENKLDEKLSCFKKLGFFQNLPMILIIFFFTCSPGLTIEGEKGSTAQMLKIRVESARIRETPSFEADVEFGLKKGDMVLIVKREEDWVLIKLDDGRTGWAHQSLFNDPNMPSEPVKTESAVSAYAPASVENVTEDTAPPDAGSDTQQPLIKEVTDIQVKITPEGDEKVIFTMSGFYTPEIFALEEAIPKVVCDFTDVNLGEKIKEHQIDVDGSFIKRVRIGVHEGEKVRVVLDLSPNKDYDVEQLFLREDNIYVLTFKSSQKTADDEPVVEKKYGF